jgi:hypothetical protein
VSNKLLHTIDALALISNLLSCIILGLVVRLLNKLTEEVRVNRDSAVKRRRLSKFVTASHISITLMYSFMQFVSLFARNLTQTFRMESALYIFGGVADLFLSLMLWSILDETKAPLVYADGSKVYSVINVIKQRSSLNSDDCEIEHEIDNRRSSDELEDIE